jgi:hypothetical protein
MNLGTQKWKKARANFAGVRDDAGRCGVACTRACPWDAQCLPKACSSQGQGSPHGQAAKAWACSSQGQGSPPWASTQGLGMHAGSPPWARSQGMGMQQPRPRQPPMGTQQPRHEHAASKAWASTQQPRPGRACSSQGLGVLAWARWHAPGRRQQGPWGHAGCLRGSGSMSRAWHAPWVGCQGRGMPLGPLEGHGSIWGGCCCQA